MSDGSALTSWHPSDLQQHVLSVFHAHGYDLTISDACKEAGISRVTYYEWHRHPEFSQWWEDEANRFFRLQLASVHVSTLRAATGRSEGSVVSGCKLFYERFDKDYCPASRNKTEISGSVGLDLAGATTEDLERLAHAIDSDTAPDLGLPDEKDGGNPTTGEVGAGSTGPA